MLRMADVELTSVEWLWFPYIPFGKLTIIQGNPCLLYTSFMQEEVENRTVNPAISTTKLTVRTIVNGYNAWKRHHQAKVAQKTAQGWLSLTRYRLFWVQMLSLIHI